MLPTFISSYSIPTFRASLVGVAAINSYNSNLTAHGLVYVAVSGHVQFMLCMCAMLFNCHANNSDLHAVVLHIFICFKFYFLHSHLCYSSYFRMVCCLRAEADANLSRAVRFTPMLAGAWAWPSRIPRGEGSPVLAPLRAIVRPARAAAQ